MAVKTLVVLVVFMFAMISTAMANKNPDNWNYNWPWYPHNTNATQPKKVVVGGSENWHFGFNYTDWALKNGPFYIGDSLVFKYDPPNGTTFPHSVYLLPNYWSFLKCDLRWAKKIADVNQGGGGGFEFVLKRWQPYYFACGEKAGFHCRNGTMKFPVMPLIHWD
ncbi:OLC1v1003034C1 [Oldenlandia corymbosa var. corymbosa]|uniref:OLC1v1003034C1 n=1 Tax=Oldenlandia corymbosa var. corymbosa TaxID=529605 RepID=A0AAV1DAX0_OLDCO|nr:OLC1v1003034C1 [Oldenlandia corymbosa var. corymbosa]